MIAGKDAVRRLLSPTISKLAAVLTTGRNKNLMQITALAKELVDRAEEGFMFTFSMHRPGNDCIPIHF